MKYINSKTGNIVDGYFWQGGKYDELLSFFAKYESLVAYINIIFIRKILEYQLSCDGVKVHVDLRQPTLFYLNGETICLEQRNYCFDNFVHIDTDEHSYRFEGNKEIVADTIIINAKDQKKIIINL